MRIGQNIGYIRVSTAEQNTIRQLDGVRLDRVFTDKCSGKDTKRLALKDLIDFARDGDTLYVHSMDRLARNLDDLRKLVNLFTAKKVKIQFIKENLLFTGEDSPMANLLLSVMGAVAEFERELINERIREGVAIAKKAGKYTGRKKSLTEVQVEEIKNLIKERYKITEIAKKYKISRDTIYRYLKT
jgi:DNA invertase Pin-like site-specific DNA recombinase